MRTSEAHQRTAFRLARGIRNRFHGVCEQRLAPLRPAAESRSAAPSCAALRGNVRVLLTRSSANRGAS